MNKEQRIKAWFNSLTPEQKRDFDELLTDFDTFTQFAQARRGNGRNFLNALFFEFECITKMNQQDLIREDRKPITVMARCLFARWLKMNTLMTLEEVGNVIDRDHATIIHYVKRCHPRYVKKSNIYNQWYMRLDEKGNQLLKQYQIKEEQ